MVDEANELRMSSECDMMRAVALLEGVRDAFYAVGDDWRVTYFNKACQDYFHIPRDEAIGRNLVDAIPGVPQRILDAIGRALGGRSQEMEFRSRCSDRIISFQAFPIHRGCGVTFRDVTDHRMLEAEAFVSAAELSTIYESAPVGLALLDRDLRYVRVNAALAQTNGVSAQGHIGLAIGEVVPDLPPHIAEKFREVFATGVPVFDLEVSGATAARPGEMRTWIENIAPVRQIDGRVQSILVSVLEITERQQAEARAKLLLDEMNHRVKNTLATIQSIASQTLQKNNNLQQFKEEFESRLVSIAKTHDALTAQNWDGAELSDLLKGELSPYAAEGRVRMVGAPVRLTARVALAMGLIAHELATNAAKYGALSTANGEVMVGWTVDDGVLRLVWQESGGPPVQPPQQRGFGSKLIERSVVRELKGKATLDFAPEGLSCTVQIPL